MPKKVSVKELIASSRFVFRTDFFDVKAAFHATRLPSENTSQRLIIVVPRRIGSAPIRNRCRRRIKALVHSMGLSTLPCDLIFFVRTSLATIPAQDLRAMLTTLHKRISR